VAWYENPSRLTLRSGLKRAVLPSPPKSTSPNSASLNMTSSQPSSCASSHAGNFASQKRASSNFAHPVMPDLRSVTLLQAGAGQHLCQYPTVFRDICRTFYKLVRSFVWRILGSLAGLIQSKGGVGVRRFAMKPQLPALALMAVAVLFPEMAAAEGVPQVRQATVAALTFSA